MSLSISKINIDIIPEHTNLLNKLYKKSMNYLEIYIFYIIL